MKNNSKQQLWIFLVGLLVAATFFGNAYHSSHTSRLITQAKSHFYRAVTVERIPST